MKKTKKQIALELIAPYYINPETCGFENGRCIYKTTDGKMCVAGKCFKDGIEFTESQKSASILSLLQIYPQEKLFKPEFANIFTNDEWYWMQRIHDTIAVGNTIFKEENIVQWIKKLNLFSIQELIDYCNDRQTT